MDNSIELTLEDVFEDELVCGYCGTALDCVDGVLYECPEDNQIWRIEPIQDENSLAWTLKITQF